MINKIWFSFIAIGVIYGFISGNIENVNKEIISSAKKALEMFFNIFPIIILWVGIMTIALESGLLNRIANIFSPILKIVFPEIPKNHEALGFISSNLIINMFGLGNAATPMGLKAMKSLKELNNNSDTASRSMITFLAINTSGITLIPTTVISLRMLHNSVNPTEIIITTITATILSTLFAVIIDKIFYNIYRKKV
jgi:spore maturation protein A